MENYINQTELLKYFKVEPKTKDYMLILSKLSKLRNGYLHKQNYKDGRHEKYYQPLLIENIDFTYIRNRVFYNKSSIDKITTLIPSYIKDIEDKSKYLAMSKKENKRLKFYGREYKKID